MFEVWFLTDMSHKNLNFSLSRNALSFAALCSQCSLCPIAPIRLWVGSKRSRLLKSSIPDASTKQGRSYTDTSVLKRQCKLVMHATWSWDLPRLSWASSTLPKCSTKWNTWSARAAELGRLIEHQLLRYKQVPTRFSKLHSFVLTGTSLRLGPSCSWIGSP